MNEHNPFIKSEISKTAFLESDNFLVIYNQSPILPGHSLVIPKREAKSLLELTDEEVIEMVLLSRRAVKILTQAFGTNAFNWTIQEGELAGQTVPHLHLHLIPRKSGDLKEPGGWYPKLKKSYARENIDSEKRPKYSHEQLVSIAEGIRKVGVEYGLID